MKYLHWVIEAEPSDVIEVTLDGRANVMLLDPPNFSHYLKREFFRYYGGLASDSPARLAPPQRGRWHLVVDLGGQTGTVRAGVRVLQGVNSAG